MSMVKFAIVFCAGLGLGVFTSPILAGAYRMGWSILFPFLLVSAALLVASVTWLFSVTGIARFRRPPLDWRDD